MRGKKGADSSIRKAENAANDTASAEEETAHNSKIAAHLEKWNVKGIFDSYDSLTARIQGRLNQLEAEQVGNVDDTAPPQFMIPENGEDNPRLIR